MSDTFENLGKVLNSKILKKIPEENPDSSKVLKEKVFIFFRCSVLY
ncbi:hypothetical protein [Leptotrichia sp. OH3620_COT-345]|nr:hypothetical protein [Leptotrichia sp. OH3620_COT-345]